MIPGTTPERSAKALKRSRMTLVDDEPDLPWEEDPAELWDVKPIVRKTQSGDVKEFFTIKYVALAWDNRTITSVRKLEKLGLFPRARYWATVGRRRDRLYTREQIETLVRLAKEYGVYSTSTRKNIAKSGFPQQLLLEW